MTDANLLGLDTPQVWDTDLAFQHLRAQGQVDTKRTAERRLHSLGILPTEVLASGLRDENGKKPVAQVLEAEIAQARARRNRVLFAQLHTLPGGLACLHANDLRGARYWIPASTNTPWGPEQVSQALHQLQGHLGKALSVFPHGHLAQLSRAITGPSSIRMLAYPPALDASQPWLAAPAKHSRRPAAPHLQRLEAESIHILREAVAEANNPAMLYSVGKDSTVMLHLARKAFYPAPPPFPLLHVDTRWKFQQMYQFRDQIAHQSGMELLVHTNPEAIAKDINPFDHGSALHTDITKTQGLKQALDLLQFDLVFGGARRDEEKSRAKERIFSFRTATHRWDPKRQRPELWNLYNTQKSAGESIRVFPLSNWTELDIWQYIYQESIPVVPLYFAQERPVVVRDGMLLMVDDDRFRVLPGETIRSRKVRFRTLGCYPLTGAVESNAENVADILLELVNAHSSERQGRAIDSDASASMEKKKQEGYF